MSKRKKAGVVAAALVLLLAAGVYVTYFGGELEDRGKLWSKPVPKAMVAERALRQLDALKELQSSDAAEAGKPSGGTEKQILFGDLHVHTTFSADAFMMSLPLLAGEGAHPPADACDFARFCSQLDFYSLNDHAESLTPRRWQETKASVRECNAVADPNHPDVVAFTGWEWTQVGRTAEEHYGHKNVIFRDQSDEALPARPIAAVGFVSRAFGSSAGTVNPITLASIPIRDFSQRQRYKDVIPYYRELQAVERCPTGVLVRELPVDCLESATTPEVLFDKLTQWGFDTLVIPHGGTWGFYTPPGYTYDKQLASTQHDADKQRLIEVYSGHGNSEEYQPWRAVEGEGDKLTCPAPTAGYEPCCHRAGELIRARCRGVSEQECERRVQQAKQRYLQAGVSGHLTVPGAKVEDWKDCGQCRDCFDPSFSYRPGGSTQYILAKGDFTIPGKPNHATLGFIASSDNHSSRPGTGYKEYARRKMTEATGARSKEWRELVFGGDAPPTPESVAMTQELLATIPPFRVVHAERQASFFLTGGLVAVHSGGRDREAIWKALKRREVYGTSGPRILLWFDMLNDGGGKSPMGSVVRLGRNPRFVVRAAGAYKQKPGCPDWSATGIGPERIERLCAGECYNPSDQRLKITRIEVVRIRPQRLPNEAIAPLIDDDFKRLDCPAGATSCTVEFKDDSFVASRRTAIYYVRAIQEPTQAGNAGDLRCERDQTGSCKRAAPCYGDYRTPLQEDCLSPTEQRAWSSPIFVHFDAAAAAESDSEEGGRND